MALTWASWHACPHVCDLKGKIQSTVLSYILDTRSSLLCPPQWFPVFYVEETYTMVFAESKIIN